MAAVYFLCVIIITTDDEGKYKLPLSDSMTEARERKEKKKDNKSGYMATQDAFRWAGAMLEKVTMASGQEWYAQKRQKCKLVIQGSHMVSGARCPAWSD